MRNQITTSAPRIQTTSVLWPWLRLGRKVLMYAFLSLFAILTIYPFLWMVSTSFKSQRASITPPPRLMPDLLVNAWTEYPELESPRPNVIRYMLMESGLMDNYTTVLTRHNFIRYTFNSFFVATMAAIGQLITSSLAGFAFARLEFYGRRALFAVLLSTALIPIEVSIIPEFLLGAKVFDPILAPIGGWMDTYAPLIIPSFMVGTFGTFLMREFFSTVPRELEEAAVIDGANTFRVYWSIFLPLSIPAMTTLFLIAFINNWNELLRPVLYISNNNMRTITMGLTTFQGAYESQWGLLLAGSVISIIPLIVIYIFAQRFVVEGIATTGLKG